MKLFESYNAILKEELILASGCTEPIALAYLAAVAKEQLQDNPEKITVRCSANVIKNVKSVTIPNTNGLKGIKAAVIAGLIAGDANKKMEVIAEVSEEDKVRIKQFVDKDIVEVVCLHDEPNLSIKLEMLCGENNVKVELMHTHTNITLIEKNGETIYQNKCDNEDFNSVLIDRSLLNIDSIYDYATTCDLSEINSVIESQATANIKIAEEGLMKNYGARVGKTILENNQGPFFKCIAYAAAASDARMSGCKYPVMTNSGSGNQGITASLPVIVYAKEKNMDYEKMIRALLLSNLITIHIKTGIGRLSAYCGVVCAASASFSAIAYLNDYDLSVIKKVITNSLATASGMICDGAKESCASKISTALFSAMLSYQMATNELCFEPECGIVQSDVEKTIKVVGYLGREGMKRTDEVVLDIMTK